MSRELGGPDQGAESARPGGQLPSWKSPVVTNRPSRKPGVATKRWRGRVFVNGLCAFAWESTCGAQRNGPGPASRPSSRNPAARPQPEENAEQHGVSVQPVSASP